MIMDYNIFEQIIGPIITAQEPGEETATPDLIVNPVPEPEAITPDPSYKPFSDWYDYDGLYELIARLMPKNGTFVELGVLHGASLNGMAKFLQANERGLCRLVGIDLFSQAPDYYAQLSGAQPNREAVEKYLSWYPGQVDIIESNSYSAAVKFPDASIDAVFVDADHSYDACYNDLASWWPKIKKGGFLFGHDYIGNNPVQKAVAAFRAAYNISEKLIYDVGQRCFIFIK